MGNGKFKNIGGAGSCDARGSLSRLSFLSHSIWQTRPAVRLRIARRRYQPATSKRRNMKDETFAVPKVKSPDRDGKKSEKYENWYFAIFALESAVVQPLPTKTGRADFSDFSKNFRGCMGEGVNES
jgi:hypothetical protein